MTISSLPRLRHSPRICALAMLAALSLPAQSPAQGDAPAPSKPLELPIAAGPFGPTRNRSSSTSVRSGFATRSSASGRIGDHRRCRWRATGTRARCISKGRRITKITWRVTGIRQRTAGRTSSRCGKRRSGTRKADGALQKCGRKIFRQHGRRITMIFFCGIPRCTMERRELRAAPRRGGRMAEGREERRPALRRLRTSRRELHLVSGFAQGRQNRSARRRAV